MRLFIMALFVRLHGRLFSNRNKIWRRKLSEGARITLETLGGRLVTFTFPTHHPMPRQFSILFGREPGSCCTGDWAAGLAV